ncbi:UDP-glucuronosyltransferase 2A2-like [Notolabrus celidotus]|uniref:UDP-glucuronosyltransferase 2A2-like n=1 Tax=Notolabrus celidotus TaxID=1203425 RepID=UPI00148FC36A|nr:UDP-glucuronosyltransferase 2A2-like [Notolabrus celidotus]
MIPFRLVTLAALLISIQRTDGGKVLVVPVDGSHWVNMKVLTQELHSRGHNITVIRPKKSMYTGEESNHYHLINLDVVPTSDTEGLNQFAERMLQLRYEAHTSISALLENAAEFMSMMHDAHKTVADTMQEIFEDEKQMQSFREAKYDVVLTDPCFGGGILLAHQLGLPLVFNVRWTIIEDGHNTIAPSPFSYVPIPGTQLTDKMTFWQRGKNVFFGLMTLQNQMALKQHYTPVVQRYFGPDVHYDDLVQAADIWLMRNDFTFEFPRPTMPNVVYMGGFQCKPSKPLPKDLEDFVQSSAEHGVIIMSLGTLVGTLPEEIADHVAAAFAELPQKVLWRHTGKRPSTLGNNTLLLDWLPQNDLLGHPKIRVFVAHGGTNGLQEAIYHGVPIVGLPLMFDQDDNLFRMRVRGVAKVLDLSTLNKDIFLDTLKAVLHEPTYRENMQELSRLHRDQPIKPLDRAMFWIEFVMRHKGAAHLKTKSYKLSWIQYHSIDVIALLLFVVMMMALICFVVVKYLLSKVFGGRRRKTD